MPASEDDALHWLLTGLARSGNGPGLLCLDENAPATAPELMPAELALLSNRWDQAAHAQALNRPAHFSDFDFSPWPPGSLERIGYRVSKEKPVTHHIINAAARCLKPGGELLLCGYKTEGTKTYIEKAADRLGCSQRARKQGKLYTARLIRGEDTGPALDDADYARARLIGREQGIGFYSKPGLYGWQKFDRGSQLLWQQAEPQLRQTPPASLLDLGCGYGYLGLLTRHLPLDRRVLTDNNAAALAMARHNAEHNAVPAEVIAADCADRIDERFEAILCNPPFHRGFGVSGDLTDRFLDSARAHLAPGGRALFVVNRFIPLAQKARDRFDRIRLLADREGFQVFALEAGATRSARRR